MKTPVVVLVALSSLVATAWDAKAPVAQGIPGQISRAAVPLAQSIVGSWKGDAFTPWELPVQRVNFGRTDLELRFTDYGILHVRIGAFSAWSIEFPGCSPARPGASWVADYLLLGNSVLISVHGTFRPVTLSMSGVAISNDTLEALGGFGVQDGANGCVYIGNGIRLRRQ